MKQLSLVSMGSDPEVFIRRDGILHMAVGVFPGDKKEAHRLTDDVSILEDNVLLEYNVAPSFSKEEFVDKQMHAFNFVRGYAAYHGYDIHVSPCESFPMKMLLQHPQAMEFGCDPDHDAWTRKINQPGNPQTELRSAGAHIHFGLSGFSRHDVFLFARLFEVFYMEFMLNKEVPSMRRTLYGKASSIRLKPYGFEYRTPSNFWIDNPEFIAKNWEIAEAAVQAYNDGMRVDKADEQKIRLAINENLISLAKDVSQKYMVPQLVVL